PSIPTRRCATLHRRQGGSDRVSISGFADICHDSTSDGGHRENPCGATAARIDAAFGNPSMAPSLSALHAISTRPPTKSSSDGNALTVDRYEEKRQHDRSLTESDRCRAFVARIRQNQAIFDEFLGSIKYF